MWTSRGLGAVDSYNWEQLPVSSGMGWREASDEDRTEWSPGFAQILTAQQLSAHRAELPHLIPEEKEKLCPVEADAGTAAQQLHCKPRACLLEIPGSWHGLGWKGPQSPPCFGDTFHYPRAAALGLTFPWQSATSPSLSSSSAMLCYIWAKKGEITDDNLLFLF